MVKPDVLGISAVPAPNDTMRSSATLPLRRAVFALSLAAVALTPAVASAQLRRNAPTSLSDAEFWDLFTTMSEPGGSFASENFVSNEMTFQHVIPVLKRTVTPDGVYLGVGPEQNFTYIANLKPRMAVIFDIRRQNAMAHLMYKAFFETSATRADFVSRLFSRPLAGRVASTAKVADLFAVATAAARSDSAYDANRRLVFATLVNKHHFALTPGDSAGIEHLLEVFYEAGPEIDYSYRLGRRGPGPSSYPTFGLLQTLTNADSVQMAFLASEENYRVIREMHQRNLIVPVVGDFAGPKAIRAVGEYLKQRNMTVSAFYLSNVEQYLFQNGVAERFYENVATLPLDSGSTFIRSVPPGGVGGGLTITSRNGIVVRGFGGSIIGSGSLTTSGGTNVRVSITDTAGYRQMRITQDTAGGILTRTYRDSAGVMVLQGTQMRPGINASQQDSALVAQIQSILTRQDSIQARYRMPNAVSVPSPSPFAIARTGTIVGGMLASGIASMKKTLAEYAAGNVVGYGSIISMTKLDNWK